MAEQIFQAGIKSVLPDKIIRDKVKWEDGSLVIDTLSFNPDDFDHIYVIGAGKATALMAKEVESLLGDKITGGHVIVKYGAAVSLERIKITEAGHPVPDENGIKATEDIIRMASRTTAGDLVLCLLSGGGSSLLVDVPEGCTPEDIEAVNELLVRSGAMIHEINTVRKHLSGIKGGGLARKFYPSMVVTLVLSDVIGDALDVIASGPAFPDPTTFADAWTILDAYQLTARIPRSVVHHLHQGIKGVQQESPKENDPIFDKVYHHIIGSNSIALKASCRKAQDLGLQPVIISNSIAGDCEEVAKDILGKTSQYRKKYQTTKPLCLLAGGEPALKVEGSGLGGRNQHLALLLAMLIEGRSGITFLSAGTDGTDGPTSAAGAVVDGDTFSRARSAGLDPGGYLRNFDSFHFFEKAGGHIITGPTGTNVMDMMIVIRKG